MSYRENSKPTTPHGYCTPTGKDNEVIFYDSIVKLRVEIGGRRLEYHLVNGEVWGYSYVSEEEAKKHLRIVAESKQEWDEYKLRLGRSSIAAILDREDL